MVAWAEELGAEATTVTELLEEDNEEVDIGAFAVDAQSHRKGFSKGVAIWCECSRSDCINSAGEAGDNGPDPESKPESNFQRSEGNSSTSYIIIECLADTIFQVHKFMIAPKDFSLPGGELTPTMKLKRHTVMEMYEKKIQQVLQIFGNMWQKSCRWTELA